MITHADLDALINRAAFREWQSRLIYQGKRHRSLPEADQAAIQRDTAQRQQVLAGAIAHGPHAVRDFLCDISSSLEAARMLNNLPTLPRPLTEAEMAQTTFHVDREVSIVLDDWGITPMLAGESSFWALCHARWIGDGMFPDGVALVFAGGEKTASDTLAHEGEALTVAEAHRVLQGSVVWETFVMTMIRRLASLNAPHARAAVVLALCEQSRRSGGRSVPREVVINCMQKVAQLGDRFSFALVDWTLLVEAAAESLDVEVNDAVGS